MNWNDHLDMDVKAALTRLADALCRWERATGRRSIMIFKEDGGFACRLQDGKPIVLVDLDDAEFARSIE